jgi:acyl-CoA oxidase
MASIRPLDPRLESLLATADFDPHSRYSMPLREYMLLTIERARIIYREGLISNSMWLAEPGEAGFSELHRAVGWINTYDLSLGTSILDHQIAGNALLTHGSAEQVSRYRAEIDTFSTVYAFAATEVGQGSDVKNIGTRARYDADSQQFILTTPDPGAAKCWIGNTMHTATVAMVLSRLEVDGRDEGHHWFRVPLRSAECEPPFSGIRISPAHPKGGVVGNQTGVISFAECRVDRSALMAGWAGVDDQGRYVATLPFERRFIRCLSTFLQERVFTVTASAYAQLLGSSITLSYGRHRIVFGEPLIGHTIYRRRLLPLIARGLAGVHATEYLWAEFERLYSVEPVDESRRRLSGLVAGFKAGASWDAKHGLQVMRELTGSHGYHHHNQIVSLAQDFDITTTFTGDNIVLCNESLRATVREQITWPQPIAPAHPPSTVAESLDWLSYLRDSVLANWNRDGDAGWARRYALADYAYRAVNYWKDRLEGRTDEVLCELYALDTLVDSVDLLTVFGSADSRAVLSMIERHRELCDTAGSDLDTVLELLGTPKILITAPIAFADYAERIVNGAEMLENVIIR